MRGLSSLERIILESIGTKIRSFEEIHHSSGLQENVCFNLLQALIIRGIVKTTQGNYHVSETISPLLMEELNGVEARKAESLEMIEAILDQSSDRIFRFQKVALDARDEKIFLAMLSNLDSFLRDANAKAERHTQLKERKVIFWGVGEVQKVMKQVMGR